MYNYLYLILQSTHRFFGTIFRHYQINNSLFCINHCHNVKQERECNLYGKLIAIVLYFSMMFKIRELLLQKERKELIEYKVIGIIQGHLLLYSIQKDTKEITRIRFACFAYSTYYRKMGENLIDARRK